MVRPMRVDVVSIFPEYLSPLNLSLIGKAIRRGDVDVAVHDLRDFTSDPHRTVDDAAFGGGPGMVMRPQPWGEALDYVRKLGSADVRPTLVIPTPSGTKFTQPVADELAQRDWLIFACGRYEGIDARVAAYYSDEMDVLEVSVGDYVLAGGEAAVLVICEAVIRLLPGVLGNVNSAPDDSFAKERDGAALEGPVYTRPAQWRGLGVPEVLLSGHHEHIARWREQESAARTARNRPDLVAATRDERPTEREVLDPPVDPRSGA